MLEKLPEVIGHALRHQRAGLDDTLFRRADLRSCHQRECGTHGEYREEVSNQRHRQHSWNDSGTIHVRQSTTRKLALKVPITTSTRSPRATRRPLFEKVIQ